MTPTAKRNRIIATARAEYQRQTHTTKGVCSEAAWINQSLRDAGLKVVGGASDPAMPVIGFDVNSGAADWLRELAGLVGIPLEGPDTIPTLVERVAAVVADANTMFAALKRTGAVPELRFQYDD